MKDRSLSSRRKSPRYGCYTCSRSLPATYHSHSRTQSARPLCNGTILVLHLHLHVWSMYGVHLAVLMGRACEGVSRLINSDRRGGSYFEVMSSHLSRFSLGCRIIIASFCPRSFRSMTSLRPHDARTSNLLESHPTTAFPGMSI